MEEAVDTHKNFVDEDVLSYFEGEDAEKEFPIQEWTRIFRIKLKDGTEINGEIDDSEMAAKYGAGLAEHFSDVNIKDENLKQMLLTQIAFFNCRTKLTATFDFYKSGKKKNEKIKDLFAPFNKYDYICRCIFSINRHGPTLRKSQGSIMQKAFTTCFFGLPTWRRPLPLYQPTGVLV